jgi:hypothetical protein
VRATPNIPEAIAVPPTIQATWNPPPPQTIPLDDSFDSETLRCVLCGKKEGRHYMLTYVAWNKNSILLQHVENSKLRDLDYTYRPQTAILMENVKVGNDCEGNINNRLRDSCDPHLDSRPRAQLSHRISLRFTSLAELCEFTSLQFRGWTDSKHQAILLWTGWIQGAVSLAQQPNRTAGRTSEGLKADLLYAGTLIINGCPPTRVLIRLLCSAPQRRRGANMRTLTIKFSTSHFRWTCGSEISGATWAFEGFSTYSSNTGLVVEC